MRHAPQWSAVCARELCPRRVAGKQLAGCFRWFRRRSTTYLSKISSPFRASGPTWVRPTCSANARKCSISSDANVTPPRQSRSHDRAACAVDVRLSHALATNSRDDKAPRYALADHLAPTCQLSRLWTPVYFLPHHTTSAWGFDRSQSPNFIPLSSCKTAHVPTLRSGKFSRWSQRKYSRSPARVTVEMGIVRAPSDFF